MKRDDMSDFTSGQGSVNAAREATQSAGPAAATVAAGITNYPRLRRRCVAMEPVAVCSTMEPQEAPQPADQSAEEQALTEKQQRELTDEEKQEEFRRAHLIQLRRLQCPGCGETELF